MYEIPKLKITFFQSQQGRHHCHSLLCWLPLMPLTVSFFVLFHYSVLEAEYLSLGIETSSLSTLLFGELIKVNDIRCHFSMLMIECRGYLFGEGPKMAIEKVREYQKMINSKLNCIYHVKNNLKKKTSDVYYSFLQSEQHSI